MAAPYTLTASQALSLMRKGELKVEDYARSLLSRISQRDAQVKAWAHLDPDYVLEQARLLDQIPADQRGPLHGIAIGVKDVILTKDQPTRFNSPIYTDAPVTGVDAGPIITLRAAGALIFGKTTTTEFAATTTGPKTSNPHDLTRTPGGSSSGSGAAVADYQVPIALGTQTGGSTIRPGSFNGVYAFKPTWGSISREGLAQYSMTCDTLGLYARCAEDLQLLADVFRLADDEEVGSGGFEVKGAKIAFCRTSIWPKAQDGTTQAWEKAKKILSNAGASVEEIDLPEDFANVAEWHRAVLAGEGRTSFLGNYLYSKDKLDTFLHAHVENATKLSRKAQLDAYDGCAKLRPVWDEIASKHDAVFTPSVVDEAPVGLGSTGDSSFNSMWTILQVPAVNIPGFAGSNSLPIGLTLVGPRYRDQHVLHASKAIGALFEKYGGFESKVLN